MYEYPSFDSSPIIGGFYAEDPDLALGMTVCHEMAHAVQFYRVVVLGSQRCKPHGPDFKTPYANIRAAIFNKLLPNQVTAKKQYEELLKDTIKPYKMASTKELNHLFGI
jgi:predicted SprT family Zn-dependent metalloprotease